MNKPATPVLHILLGPTASGKERVALAAAERLGGEILSVDSMKIYRRLDIGTAKPSAADRARVPHHGLDLVDPEEDFSVAAWVQAAEEAIAGIAARGKPVILSGGTALYYKGLLEGLFDAPQADPVLREELKARAREEGSAELHAELADLDPAAAAKIHPNDVRRLVRALEVVRLTGRPISAQQTQWRSGGAVDPSAYRYPVAMVGLSREREALYRRIESRVDRMMAAGLLEEARWVHARRAAMARTPLQAVGYKEFFPLLDGEVDEDDAVSLLKKNTRHLAKSQMTWFRKFPCAWVDACDADEPEALAERVVKQWASCSGG